MLPNSSSLLPMITQQTNQQSNMYSDMIIFKTSNLQENQKKSCNTLLKQQFTYTFWSPLRISLKVEYAVTEFTWS